MRKVQQIVTKVVKNGILNPDSLHRHPWYVLVEKYVQFHLIPLGHFPSLASVEYNRYNIGLEDIDLGVLA